MWETGAHIPEEYPGSQSSVEAIGGWELPNEYYQGRNAANDYSMSTFSKWLRSGVLNHRPTNTLMGGPYGVKWAVLILLRAFSCLQAGGRKRKAAARGYLDPEEELLAVQSDVSWLCAELESSSMCLLCAREDPLPDYNPSMHQNVMFQRAQHHLEPLQDVSIAILHPRS
jgi:hypothetical protein